MSKQSQSKPMTQQQLNHHANQRNPNGGTSGTNTANAKVHGHRSHQLQVNLKSR